MADIFQVNNIVRGDLNLAIQVAPYVCVCISVALSQSVSEIRKNQYADVVFQMDGAFAISSLRVADEE